LKVAQDGEEAVDYLRRRGRFADAVRPDMVLTDMNLPKVDGLQILAEIKTDTDLRRIPTVMLTTSASPRDIVKAYDLHANLCMTKPPEFDRFCETVRFIQQWLTLAEIPET
jgi:two-component system, chemotaxis family, response regulator Rcp1